MPRVVLMFGSKVVADVPVMRPWSYAYCTASMYQASGETSVKMSLTGVVSAGAWLWSSMTMAYWDAWVRRSLTVPSSAISAAVSKLSCSASSS